MKVVWFEVTEPAGYRNSGEVIGGWQDSLENIVKEKKNIELYVVFEGKRDDKVSKSNNITYIPIPTIVSSIIDRFLNSYTWKRNEERIVKESLKVIKSINPDIIHIFGMEWPWGSVARHTDIPCVVHIMGSIIPYYNAMYPPCYNKWDHFFALTPNIFKSFRFYMQSLRLKSNVKFESERWNSIKYYMGRTNWDKALTNTLHPGAMYYHVDEALRSVFLNGDKQWKFKENETLKLISTGCRNFWKGPDMMLKTAKILKRMGVDFEWDVVGAFPCEIQVTVERKEKARFIENNIRFLGYMDPNRLSDLLCGSTIYVHTAYIENSPNSICEAQILGVPIVSTNVGGISTLLENSGVLVPANDPWQMANAIVELWRDSERMKLYSILGRKTAEERHSPEKIYKELIDCYTDVLRLTR